MNEAAPVLLEIMNGDALGLTAAGKQFPAGRGNAENTDQSTVWRWINRGMKSRAGALVKLEAARVGGRWLTSKAALLRFVERLTPPDASAVPAEPKPAPRTPSARQRSAQAAAQRLAAVGA